MGIENPRSLMSPARANLIPSPALRSGGGVNGSAVVDRRANQTMDLVHAAFGGVSSVDGFAARNPPLPSAEGGSDAISRWSEADNPEDRFVAPQGHWPGSNIPTFPDMKSRASSTWPIPASSELISDKTGSLSR